MTKIGCIVAALALLLATAAPARAANVQTSGPEVFPGRFQASVAPIAGQVGFTNRSPTGYKLIGDFAGNIAGTGFGSVWLGAQLSYTFGLSNCYVVDCGGDFALWAYAMLTFEKLIPIPLVPFARAGVGGDVLLYQSIAGAIAFHVGGGVHYYLLKWLGLGVETSITVGPGIYPQGAGTLFYGHWDVGAGARFHF
jgi:hypothetical protein